MTTPDQYKLVDENTDLIIDGNYDPLISDAFEDYIHITEKTRPGKRRSFNNVPDKETRDATVTGLVLYWGKDIKKSKLRA